MRRNIIGASSVTYGHFDSFGPEVDDDLENEAQEEEQERASEHMLSIE